MFTPFDLLYFCFYVSQQQYFSFQLGACEYVCYRCCKMIYVNVKRAFRRMLTSADLAASVQYNVRHLVLSLWQYPDPCITARSLDPARFDALAPYTLVQSVGGPEQEYRPYFADVTNRGLIKQRLRRRLPSAGIHDARFTDVRVQSILTPLRPPPPPLPSPRSHPASVSHRAWHSQSRFLERFPVHHDPLNYGDQKKWIHRHQN